MKKQSRIVQGCSREHLQAEIEKIIDNEKEYEWEFVGFSVVSHGGDLLFFQSMIRTILDNSDFPGFGGKQ